MSHRDAVVVAPPGFAVTGATTGAEIAAFEHPDRRLFGLQWHPEVMHTAHGQTMLERFLYDGAGIEPSWTTANIIDDAVADIRARVGDRHVLCGLSGGVDSAVAAALVHRAVGDQLTCVFVDHGLLRKGEREQVERDYVAATGIRLVVVDASEKFLTALRDVTDPEHEAQDHRHRVHPHVRGGRGARSSPPTAHGDVEFLVQGTLYPDVVESGGGTGTANIKSHHNVGGLPDDLQFELIEPLKALFKDEVRAVGLELGLPESMVWRQPFPGPGLAIRIVGAVDAARLATVREADAIAREELEAGRARARRLAVPRGAARRRALGRRAGRRAHLRAPDRAAADHERGRHDRRLGAPPDRGARADLHPHHQRGRGRQPGRARHLEQAARDDRVGVTARVSRARCRADDRPEAVDGGGHAAVDPEVAAGDERRRRAGEPLDRRRDVLGGADAGERRDRRASPASARSRPPRAPGAPWGSR